MQHLYRYSQETPQHITLYIKGGQRDKKDHITLVIRDTELYQIIGKSLQ